MRSAKTKLVGPGAIKAAAAPTPLVAAAAATLTPLPSSSEASLYCGQVDWLDYAIDVSQRSALFMQALVERAIE